MNREGLDFATGALGCGGPPSRPVSGGWRRRRVASKDGELGLRETAVLGVRGGCSSGFGQAISVIGGGDGAAPAQLRAFVNREGLDFAMAGEVAPVQQWDLQEDLGGRMEYPTQCAPGTPAHTASLHANIVVGA